MDSRTMLRNVGTVRGKPRAVYTPTAPTSPRLPTAPTTTVAAGKWYQQSAAEPLSVSNFDGDIRPLDY